MAGPNGNEGRAPSDADRERTAGEPGRRGFVSLLAWATALPWLGLWRSLTLRQAARPQPTLEIVLPVPAAEGLTLHGPLAVWREGEAVGAVSLRCPHLGCTVRADDAGGSLVCPCHGSRYDTRGRLLRGPSRRGLTPLSVERHPATETLSVELPG